MSVHTAPPELTWIDGPAADPVLRMRSCTVYTNSNHGIVMRLTDSTKAEVCEIAMPHSIAIKLMEAIKREIES